MADVCVDFRPPCWCPSRCVLAWRLHAAINLDKKVSPRIVHKKTCCDLNPGERVCIVTFFLFSDSGLYLLNGFDFDFDFDLF